MQYSCLDCLIWGLLMKEEFGGTSGIEYRIYRQHMSVPIIDLLLTASKNQMS